jgi:superfamily II DNA or RNA helicase
MKNFNKNYIQNSIAASPTIFKRGEDIFKLGSYNLIDDLPANSFTYLVDGNYGDYEVEVSFQNGDIKTSCNCPYPGEGCKHVVAVCFDIAQRHAAKTDAENAATANQPGSHQSEAMTFEEIRAEALERRKAAAKSETFEVTEGDYYKGEHLLTNKAGRRYAVTLHNPQMEKGHCDCPDFSTNGLGTCKHLVYLLNYLKQKDDFETRVNGEKFPFIHLYWDSVSQAPMLFHEKKSSSKTREHFHEFFNENGEYSKKDLTALYPLLEKLEGSKEVRIDETIFQKLEISYIQNEITSAAQIYKPDFSLIRASLYPYQKEGVQFALFKKSAIIADEMGLGKTIQAISLAVLKKQAFHFEKVLVICPSSLKEQWKKEIEKFTGESAVIVEGGAQKRRDIYRESQSFFTITNYEAVMRDILAINRFKPDLVILDEAQRIKNFETKTHQAINTISRRQSIVLSGTPLENKLEDLYSIVQFADPEMLTPLWKFAASHFVLFRDKKNSVSGYKNLDVLHKKLKSLIIRRKKEEVLKDLPQMIRNDYYIDLTAAQRDMHQGFSQSLLPILRKKFITPLDFRKIQRLLLCMRLSCNSTYLIDRETNLSPKLDELEKLLVDLVIQNRRKTIVFSEWSTMTMLIGKVLSNLQIPFVEFTGNVPVAKRQNLVDEFNTNPDCMVFLSTDAGGVGLNLQAADCVINFELPWNPARLNQRIGRVMRIGQKSKSVNVINFIARNSIEERVYAGINLKQELFSGVFDGTVSEVEFSREKKNEFINKVREMLGDENIITTESQHTPETLPESTPHFLNPHILNQEILQKENFNFAEIEAVETNDENREPFFAGNQTAAGSLSQKSDTGGAAEIYQNTAEFDKMEEVLNQGMQFLNGLMSMAAGKPLIDPDTGNADQKTITVDRQTGEVIMKFKLPGF